MNRITFITGSLPPIRCGVGFYSWVLLGEMHRAGLKNIDVLSTESVDKPPYPLQTTPDWRIRRLPQLIKKIKANNPSIVHIEYPAVGYRRNLGINLLPLWLRLRLKKVRIIVTLHEYHESRLVGRMRNLLTITAAHKILVSNEADRLSLPGFLRQRTQIVPIGSNITIAKTANPEKAFADAIKKAGLSSGKPTLLFFGFARLNKGLGVLPKLLSEPGMEKYQVLLMTDLDKNDLYQRGLENSFNSFNSEEKRIGWTGFLPDEQVSSVLQAGDYFMLPQNEPLTAKSGTAIAAALHGLVVISAAGDGNINHPFKNDVNSCLVLPATAENLARAVVGLDNNPAKKKLLAKGAAELSNYFSWDNIVRLHKELYE